MPISSVGEDRSSNMLNEKPVGLNELLRYEKCLHCHKNIYDEYLAYRSRDRELRDDECDGLVHPWCKDISHPGFECYSCGLSSLTMRTLTDHIASTEICSRYYDEHFGPGNP